MKLLRMLPFAAVLLCAAIASAQSPWSRTTNGPPANLGTMLLLTHGTVIAHEENDQSGNWATRNWYKLTPDINGSYSDGTWLQTSPLALGLRAAHFGSAVLPGGRVVVEGGEYNQYGAGFTTLGERAGYLLQYFFSAERNDVGV